MGPAPVGRRRRILVVDDTELNRVLTAAVLEGQAYEVDCVADGAAALAAVEDTTYDLVLMDLDMPGVDGFETASRLKARDRETPVAALTARDSELVRARARALGLHAHLQRPLAPAHLAASIDAILGDESSRTRIFRPEIQEEIVSRLGAARTTMFLAYLLEQCEALRAMLARPNDDLALRAHDLASTSGMLGYEELSLGCRAVMTATEAPERVRACAALEGALRRAMSVLRQQTRGAEAA